MLLNCDLGESYGAWTMGDDKAAMPLIDQANIACGFHAGDPLVMSRTILLAKEHGVTIGAHPSYPDLAGFGRRSMNCSPAELKAYLLYQVSALDGMALSHGALVSYVKPHGALYNDMMASVSVRQTVMEAVRGYSRPIKLMLQATEAADAHRQEAKDIGIEVLFEAFADRRYDDDGSLLSRKEAGALLNQTEIQLQIQQLIDTGTLTTRSGKCLSLQADSLCVHGDTPEAITALTFVRSFLSRKC